MWGLIVPAWYEEQGKKIRLSSCDLGIYLYVVVFAVRLLMKSGVCAKAQTP
jgi:hypothetical protein